jgi:hypothetical protein
MELSEKTIAILNNFKTIQSNMVFHPGNGIATLADARNIAASATIDIDVPTEFGIFDLSEFLATLNLVDNPKLNLKKDHALVESTSGLSRIKYFFSDPEMLTAPQKMMAMPSEDVTFILDESTLNRLKRAASTLGHETLVITPSNGALELSVCDLENSTSNVFSIDVAGTFEGEFKFVMNIDNLKVMATDYDVTISKKLISHFKSRNKDLPVEYWIAMEKASEA